MPKYSEKQIADGLKAARGMVYVAARQMGCSPDTIKARLKKSPRLAAIHEAEGEMVLDTAELKLGQAIVNGESWAIKFALSTKGKGRGYVEKEPAVGLDVEKHLGSFLTGVQTQADMRTQDLSE